MAEDFGGRSFGAIHTLEKKQNGEVLSEKAQNVDEKVAALRMDIIGNQSMVDGPYGKVPCVYADWTASGRALGSIERYLMREVMPLYGNTHTTSSITGHQSTCFRHEARQIVAEAVNAKVTGRAAVDTVIFTGNGTTAALKKVVESLGFNNPLPTGYDEETFRPVVFTSAFEHHSNLLPWRESVADVVTIAYDPTTGVSLPDLRARLTQYKHRKVKVGAFAAASNVTGILTDVDAVAVAMHEASGYVIFDYATAAPYVIMDMNPARTDGKDATKDAIIFSGHKFLGGPGAPGVLVAKRRLLRPQRSVPTTVGGGTVFYVTEDHHRYLSNWEEREEGGTPNVLGDIKVGLALHVKQSIGARWIEARERSLSAQLRTELSQMPNIAVLGNHLDTSGTSKDSQSSSLPIIPFLVHAGHRFLHHNFVCALLNDLFGVQSRGGCQCAGPFSQLLLGLNSETNHRLELALLDKHEVLRPGFSRLSIPYWCSQEELTYVLSALKFVSEHGWKFLAQYRYQPKTGEWAHASRMTKFPERKWLSHFNVAGDVTLPTPSSDAEEQESSFKTSSARALAHAHTRLTEMESAISKGKAKKLQLGALDVFEGLRWFALPGDEGLGSTMGPSALAEIRGPIRVHHDLTCPTSSSETGSNGQATAYAEHRASNKMREERGGHSMRLPRYVELASGSDSGEGEGGGGSATISASSELLQAPSSSSALPLPLPLPLPSSVLGAPADERAPPQHKRDENGKRPQPSERDESDRDGRLTLPSAPQAVGSHHFPAKLDAHGKIVRRIHAAKCSKKIMRLVGTAISDWNMIEDGDRLLLGLSGGKDSLALLHMLLQKQRNAPIRFEIACATVDPRTDSFDPSPLIAYMDAMGVTYHYLSEPIVDLAKEKMQGDSLCAFCSRFKRGLLYSCCRDYKYNKLVLAQHLDDLAESFIMSAFHGGQVRTMKANYKIEAGDVRVIRPLVYVREVDTRDFSQQARLPIINENCPACFEEPKERHRVKKLLQQEEASVPDLFSKLRTALTPLMDDDIYVATKSVMQRIATIAKGRKGQQSTRGGTKEGCSTSVGKRGPGVGLVDGSDLPASKRQANTAEATDKESMLSKRYECTDGLCFEIA